MNIKNPYLDLWGQPAGEYDLNQIILRLLLRQEAVQKYSWAIPNQEAIDYLVKLSPLVEIGAGGGYWAHLISQAGGDIICFDRQPKHRENSWFDVKKGNASNVKEHKNRTLFLCWPPYKSPMAFNCLSNYKGNHLVYVGEPAGMAAGDDKFFRSLESYWKEIDYISIPRWYGMDDGLFVYKRISSSN